jgi:glyoxylase-like metal-dependent hydrolase (beta-lactamase superfamily II)
VNFAWEQLGEGVHRCRLPFLDVTIGLVCGRTGTLLIDTGTTLAESNAVKADVAEIADSAVSHIVLTHNHFDHILGSSAFEGAAVYCAPEVAATIANRTDHLYTDAVRHGADPEEVARAVSALRTPQHPMRQADVDLGGRTVEVIHPGSGHTRHDLLVVVAGQHPVVVFCGDLVEESGIPTCRPGLRLWDGFSTPAVRMPRSSLVTAPPSTPPSSSSSSDGCAVNCDEFRIIDVT